MASTTAEDLDMGEQAHSSEKIPVSETETGSPWAVDNFPPGQDMMDLLPTSSLDDIPLLEAQGPMQTVHYPSPVSSGFLDMDQPFPSHDVKDHSAEPGVCGLYNLGNTCFMNSGLQCLLNHSQHIKYFIEEFRKNDPDMMETFSGKFAQLLYKVWSGRYSMVQPLEFKEVLGMYHPQFKDYRQHDCQEFLALLLDDLHEQLNKAAGLFKPDEDSDEEEMSDCPVTPPEAVLGDTPRDQNGCSPTFNVISQADSPSNNLKTQSALLACTSQSQVPLQENNQAALSLACASQIQAPSEDSNQSVASIQSSDSSVPCEPLKSFSLETVPEDLRKCDPKLEVCPVNKDVVEAVNNKEEPSGCIMVSDVDSTSEMNPACSLNKSFTLKPDKNVLTNNAGKGMFLSNIEEFYMKDTKTLNTNVLADEFSDVPVTMDSKKFHKQDNLTCQPAQADDMYENLAFETKTDGAKRVKDTNLLANQKDKFSDGCYTKALILSDTTESCSINNIKRIKIDEDQKNLRMQTMRKVNTAKNPTKEDQPEAKFNSGLEQSTSGGEGGSMAAQQASTSYCSHSFVPSEQRREEDIRMAARAWRKYTSKNQSVVVDTFQGQFRSMVVCSECHHVSVTFEPFMYLSVPLPHAMERQISVIFVPCDNKQPVLYLLNLHKNDKVIRLKQQLMKMINEESCDIIVAEVLDNHISRILEDNTLLRFVNDSNRTIYAFEMMPAPQIDDISTQNDDTSMLIHKSGSGEDGQSGNNAVTSTTNNLTTPQSGDIFSNMGSFGTMDFAKNDTGLGNNKTRDETAITSSWTGDLENCSWLNNFDSMSTQSWASTSALGSQVDWQENFLNNGVSSTSYASEFSAASMWDGKDNSGLHPRDPSLGPDSISSNDLKGCGKDGSIMSTESSSTDLIGDAGLKNEEGMTEENCGMTDQWKTCAICLEEMADCDLMVHTMCGGTLCHSCLEMSCKHFGDAALKCPVCSSSVNPAEDFIQLDAMADYKPKTRILSVPIVQRYDCEEEGKTKMSLFGHPNIMYLPSSMSGEFVYESVDRVVPCLANYTILLTDGQGYHCSRCLYHQHCSGCELSRDGQVNLLPGDHLTVRFTDLTQDHMDSAQKYTRHHSMDLLRPKEPLTLYDCLRAFSETEVLDENNPWYCPCCHKNRRARKTLTVWKYPDMLIIYFKRFVFHELSSTKIDNQVTFPLEGLDLTDYMTGPITDNLNYDLHSCICHFGGANSGHYTAYTRHPLSNLWYYYNDETAMQQSPCERDCSNAYILFYERQGSRVEFAIPDDLMRDCGPENLAVNASSQSMEIVPYQALSNDAISQLLEDLREDEKPNKVTDTQDAETDIKCIGANPDESNTSAVQCSEPDSTYRYS